jgi:hypothetical protein
MILSHLNHVWIKGMLPLEMGWFPKITNDIDAVIWGMHAKADNPELKAQELGLKNLPIRVLVRAV